jgi:pimeloyl-ACP methyl ester carboxylesterase
MSFLIVGGRRLEARWWRTPGPAPTPAPIVLLHEGLGSVSTWREFPSALAAATGRDVFAYSRLGHGRSAARGGGLAVDFMHVEADGVVPRVLDAAGIDRAVLLGHSDGGSIALLAAARWPDRIAALALEAPHVFVEDLSVASIAAIGQRFLADGDLKRRLAAHHEHVDEVFWGWHDVWLSPAFRTWNIEDEVARVRCRVLALQGLDDEYGTSAQIHAIERVATAPLTAALIQKCGHSPHRDQPNLVLDRLAAFMAQLHA